MRLHLRLRSLRPLRCNLCDGLVIFRRFIHRAVALTVEHFLVTSSGGSDTTGYVSRTIASLRRIERFSELDYLEKDAPAGSWLLSNIRSPHLDDHILELLDNLDFDVFDDKDLRDQ